MTQATDTIPEFTYDDISDHYSKFKADIWPTNLKGVMHLKLDIERPFRSGDELSAWLHAFVAKLGQDINDQGIVSNNGA